VLPDFSLAVDRLECSTNEYALVAKKDERSLDAPNVRRLCADTCASPGVRPVPAPFVSEDINPPVPGNDATLSTRVKLRRLTTRCHYKVGTLQSSAPSSAPRRIRHGETGPDWLGSDAQTSCLACGRPIEQLQLVIGIEGIEIPYIARLEYASCPGDRPQTLRTCSIGRRGRRSQSPGSGEDSSPPLSRESRRCRHSAVEAS